MSFELVVKPSAEDDIFLAAEWYEKRASGLGHLFLLSVEATFESMKRSPKGYPEKYLNIRRALTRKFPYAVYYTMEKTRLIVLAVVHSKRDPDYHFKRISEKG